MPDLDCRTCGACCTGVISDRVDAFVLPISRREYKRLPVHVRTEAPAPFGDGTIYSMAPSPLDARRCAALSGVVGTSCSCSVYQARPEICRVFPRGGTGCLDSRREAGIR